MLWSSSIASSLYYQSGMKSSLLHLLSTQTTQFKIQSSIVFRGELDDDDLVEVDGTFMAAETAERRRFFSSILQRASKASDALGGGSLTLIPIVKGRPATGQQELKINSIKNNPKIPEALKEKLLAKLSSMTGQNSTMDSNRVPTFIIEELMSIADGQIVLEDEIDGGGGGVSIDPLLSVSRLGTRVYASGMENLAPQIRFALAQAADARQFDSESITEASQSWNAKLRVVKEALVQRSGDLCPLSLQLVTLKALESIQGDTGEVQIQLEKIRERVEELDRKLMEEIDSTGKITAVQETQILELIRNAKIARMSGESSREAPLLPQHSLTSWRSEPFHEIDPQEVTLEVSPSPHPRPSRINVSSPGVRTLTFYDNYTIVGGVPTFQLKPSTTSTRFTCFGVSSDGSRLAAVSQEGVLSLWNVTDNFTLLSTILLELQSRLVECLLFYPQDTNKILLCLNSGETYEVQLSVLETGELCHKMLGLYKQETEVFLVTHVTQLSSSGSLFIIVDRTGETSAIQLGNNGSYKELKLTGHLPYEGKPRVQIEGESVLVVYRTRQGEERSDSARTGTVIWPHLHFSDTKNDQCGIALRGEACFSNGGKYLLNWTLQSNRRYKLRLYLTKDIQSSSSLEGNALLERDLGFLVLNQNAQIVNREKFSFCDKEGELPLIAMQQQSSSGTRLVFWDTNVDELIHEIDITLNKATPAFHPSVLLFHLGVCSANLRMLGLVSVDSGVFIWTASPLELDSNNTNSTISSLLFEPSGGKLLVNMGTSIYAFAPPCLSHISQKQPSYVYIDLTLSNEEHNFKDVLEWTRWWPKEVLFTMVSTERGIMSRHLRYLIDVAISTSSEALAVVCHSRVAQCCLILIEYYEPTTKNLLNLFYFCIWGENLYSEEIKGVKRIDEDHAKREISVFFFPETHSSLERTVLFSSNSGVEYALPEFGSDQSLNWVQISNSECFAFRQSADRKKITALANRLVLIIDLEQKTILAQVSYKVNLADWLGHLLDTVQYFAYFHYFDFQYQRCPLDHRIFLQKRLRGLFEVSAEGREIFIGWDSKQNRSLVLRPETTEEEFQIALNEAQETLCHCSMMTENGQWLGVIDHQQLKNGNLVVCLINTQNNTTRRLWLGSDKSDSQTVHSHQLLTNLFLKLDSNGETLSVLELRELGNGLGTQLRQLFVGTPYTNESCIPIHTHKSIFNQSILSRDGTELVSTHGPSLLNMEVEGVSNFQFMLLSETPELLNKASKLASKHQLQVSCTYSNEESASTTLMRHAIDQKLVNTIQTCLSLLCEGLFPFPTSSAMLKECFYDLLSISLCEVEVPSVIFNKQKANSAAILGTSNTVMEWWQESNVKLLSQHWECENEEQIKELNKEENPSSITASICFFPIQDACKLGLNGIIRFLLMQEAPSWVFKTNLVKSVITWKWEKIWKKRCVHDLLQYATFLLIYTVYALGVGLRGTKLTHSLIDRLVLTLLLVLVWILAFWMLVQECLQLRTFLKDGNKRFGMWSWGARYYFFQSQWNLIELFSYTLLLFIIPILHFGYMSCRDGFRAPFIMFVGINSVLVWFKVWYYAQPFEQTGALVLLIDNVVLDCLPFLFLGFVILIGYSIALFVLFQYYLEKHPDASKQGQGETERLVYDTFSTPWRSVVSLFYAMVGAFDIQVYYADDTLSWLTTLIFVAYMAIQMVVLLNMLIAIMGDTFDRVKNEEEEQILMGRARFMDACEAALTDKESKEIEKQIGKYLYVLTPSEKDKHTMRGKWQGRINIIDENVNRAIKESEESMRRLIQGFMEALDAQREQDIAKISQHILKEHHFDENNLTRRIEGLEHEVRELSELIKELLRNQQTGSIK
eukprot:g8067.t1